MTNNEKSESKEKQPSQFEMEISRLPPQIKSKLESKEKAISKITDAIKKSAKDKSMGFFINPSIEIKNNMPTPNYDNLTLNFLLDDFENPIQVFDPKLLLGTGFDKLLVEEKKTDEYNQPYSEYHLKEDKNIKFNGTSISILRENCFDAIYDDLKRLGTSFVYEDSRGFISALKTIDIHRNMLLQKFEKYVVVYAGAGSWLRGEKSNDFDVFVVIDDTDVKRMPRLQVKDQLTKIIWQMSREVAALTGIQIHIQVYLLTDFWDALKDAHPVMFTFLRDGVPFYDRGIYGAWKELLKLGKIRPSAEAIDMHMNAGTQLIDRAKKMFADIAINEIYYSVLNPSQAILMLKGYNPTTPKETVKMFKEVLLAKEKSISQKDVNTLENAVKTFKELEHNKEKTITGKDLDNMIKDAEDFLKNIKKMFEQITEERTKESIISSYNELVTQIRTLPGFADTSEKEIFKKFEDELIRAQKLPAFVKKSLENSLKAKSDYEKGKITITEVNKVLKEMRNVLSEIKEYRDKNVLSEVNSKKLMIRYDENKSAELFSYDKKTILVDFAHDKIYELDSGKFIASKLLKESFEDSAKFKNLSLSEELFKAAKDVLKAKQITL